jgi:hypothetical protein
MSCRKIVSKNLDLKSVIKKLSKVKQCQAKNTFRTLIRSNQHRRLFLFIVHPELVTSRLFSGTTSITSWMDPQSTTSSTPEPEQSARPPPPYDGAHTQGPLPQPRFRLQYQDQPITVNLRILTSTGAIRSEGVMVTITITQ